MTAAAAAAAAATYGHYRNAGHAREIVFRFPIVFDPIHLASHHSWIRVLPLLRPPRVFVVAAAAAAVHL